MDDKELDYSLNCTGVQGGNGSGVWNLTVQMDAERVSKRSAIFFTPSFPGEEPTIQLETHTWISSFWVSPSGTLYACDGDRLWTRAPNGDVTHEVLNGGRPDDRHVLEVWGIDDETMFLLGQKGLVMRSSGDGWRDISIPEASRLFRMAAAAAGKTGPIYAVGENGSFWRLDGDAWTRINLRTNADLTGLAVVGPDEVYVCGRAGTCLHYSNGEVRSLTAEPRDYSAVARYRDRIYFGGGGQGIDVLEGAAVVPVKPVFGQRMSVSSSGDYLYTCGGQSFFRYDGSGHAPGQGWLRKDFT